MQEMESARKLNHLPTHSVAVNNSQTIPPNGGNLTPIKKNGNNGAAFHFVGLEEIEARKKQSITDILLKGSNKQHTPRIISVYYAPART